MDHLQVVFVIRVFEYRWAVLGGPASLSIIEEGEDVGCLVVLCATIGKIQVRATPEVNKIELNVI